MSRVALVCALASALARPTHASVDAEVMRVIDDLRVNVELRPLSPNHPDARKRSRPAPVQTRRSDGVIAQTKRLLGRLRWVMTLVVSYRLIMRSLDRFLPIPEDDDTDALDYVDFEKFLYEPTQFSADAVKL
jgi:hypothetical protein